MLGDSEVDEEGNLLVMDDQDTELLDKNIEEREISVSILCLSACTDQSFFSGEISCVFICCVKLLSYRSEQQCACCEDVPLKLWRIELEL